EPPSGTQPRRSLVQPGKVSCPAIWRLSCAALSQDGDRVDRRAGALRQPKRRDRAQEGPLLVLFAQRKQGFEPQVVEQLQAKGPDRQHVDGEVDAARLRAGGVAVAVAA